MQKLVELLANPSLRRILVYLLTFGTTALHRRFGIELDATEIIAIIATGLGYLAQSAYTDASKARSNALVEVGVMALPAAPASPGELPSTRPTPPNKP